MKSWESIATEQADIIAGLSELCSALLLELAQYREIEAEEKRLKYLEEMQHGDV